MYRLSAVCQSSAISISTADTISQEFRLVSSGGESFDWIAGVSYQNWDLDYSVNTRFSDPGLFSAAAVLAPALGIIADLNNIREFSGDNDLYAALAQVTWSLTDVVRLTVGARYTYEEKTGYR